MDFGGWKRRKELGGVGGGERIIRIYYIAWKKSIFNFKKNFYYTDERY